MLVIAIAAASVVLTSICAISLVARRRRVRGARSAAAPIVNPAITMKSPLPAIVVAARRRLARGSAVMPSTASAVADAPAVRRDSEVRAPRTTALRPSHARR